MKPKRVFISYSHDSDAHRDRVLALADRLRSHGVDAQIDQYEAAPAEGWKRWMTRQIEAADFVVLVCTPTYVQRFEGREQGGVNWEGVIASNLFEDQKVLIPVAFTRGESVPVSVRHLSRYVLDDEYEVFFRQITGRLRTAPALGPEWNPDVALMPRRSPGALLPDDDASPFVPGPPIADERRFVGRRDVLRDVLDWVEKGAPVQLLGEPRMGKTSILYALRRRRWDRPVVYVSAQGVAGAAPERFLAAIAKVLGRPAEWEKVLPLVLLVDEADALAVAGHGFTTDLLDSLRAWIQAGELVWISASRDDLEGTFQSTGVASRFLNDSQRRHVGGLDSDAIDSLLGPIATRAAEVQDLAGSWAYGLQWLGDAVWRGEKWVDDAFEEAMEPRFLAWWEGRTPHEREVLRATVRGEAVSRKVATRLERRGLVVEREGAWRCNGRAWEVFVGGR